MPLPPKHLRLAAPLKEFKIPIVSWRPNSLELKEFQKNSRVTYTVPEELKIKGREWLRVAAYNVMDLLLGEFILPKKYYSLWRRLIYGGLFQEKMYEAWIKRTKRLKGKSLNAVEEEEIRLRNMAGVRLAQYLLCRRLVLEELMNLRFDFNTEPEVPLLIEFGIRESRDWLFETYENAKKQGQKYLYLDPTLSKNEREFAKGYHAGLEILSPPEDDDWWEGDFVHFDFDSTFNEIANLAPKTMADKSFEQTKWIIKSNGNKPVEWNEANLTFFSGFFINFLEDNGQDPRDAIEAYFRSYFSQEDISVSDIDSELVVVLAGRGDKQKLMELAESHNDDEFFRQLNLNDTQAYRHQGQALNQGLAADLLTFPGDAEQILRNFCQPNNKGLELPQALEQLVEILGPGSEAVSSKLLEDLAVDREASVGWDTAIAEAINSLNELKRGGALEKGKGKAPISPADIDMTHDKGTSMEKISSNTTAADETDEGPRDSAMEGVSGPSTTKVPAAAAGGDGDQPGANSIREYINMSATLLS